MYLKAPGCATVGRLEKREFDETLSRGRFRGQNPDRNRPVSLSSHKTAVWGMHLTPEAPRSSIRALEDHSRTLGEFQERFAFRFQIQPLPSPRGAQ